MPEDREPRYLGLVHGYDRKPKRRLFELLKSQGLQANQDVTFLTNGGEEVRSLTELVTPEAEHVLDWFHITMRLTVLASMLEASRIVTRPKAPACSPRWNGSNGCSGTGISTERAKTSRSSRMTSRGWTWTTQTWANSPAPRTSSPSTSPATLAA
jgi:hypothetical protein